MTDSFHKTFVDTGFYIGFCVPVAIESAYSGTDTKALRKALEKAWDLYHVLCNFRD